LYFKGVKEWDMALSKPNFYGHFHDTEGMFFDLDEYDKKKEAAINDITAEKKDKKVKLREVMYNTLYRRMLLHTYNLWCQVTKTTKMQDFADWLKLDKIDFDKEKWAADLKLAKSELLEIDNIDRKGVHKKVDYRAMAALKHPGMEENYIKTRTIAV
jgi:hypothetical protein